MTEAPPRSPNFVFAKMMICTYDGSTMTRGSERAGIRCTSADHPRPAPRGSLTVHPQLLEEAGRRFLQRELLDRPLAELIAEFANEEAPLTSGNRAQVDDMTRQVLESSVSGYADAAMRESVIDENRWLRVLGFEAECDGLWQRATFRVQPWIPARDYNGYRHNRAQFAHSLYAEVSL